MGNGLRRRQPARHFGDRKPCHDHPGFTESRDPDGIRGQRHEERANRDVCL